MSLPSLCESQCTNTSPENQQVTGCQERKTSAAPKKNATKSRVFILDSRFSHRSTRRPHSPPITNRFGTSGRRVKPLMALDGCTAPPKKQCNWWWSWTSYLSGLQVIQGHQIPQKPDFNFSLLAGRQFAILQIIHCPDQKWISTSTIFCKTCPLTASVTMFLEESPTQDPICFQCPHLGLGTMSAIRPPHPVHQEPRHRSFVGNYQLVESRRLQGKDLPFSHYLKHLPIGRENGFHLAMIFWLLLVLLKNFVWITAQV